MPQSYSYWRRVDFVRSDTLIRSAIARWRLAGVEWLRAIFAIFLAPVPAGRCRERPGSSPAVVPPRRPSYVLLFTSHGTSVQLLKSTPALRPVFLVPTRARIATHSCAHATAYPANPEWSSRSFCSLSAARQGVSGPRVVQPFIFTRYPLQEGVSGPRVVQAFIFTRYPPPRRRIRTASGPGVHLHSLSAAKKAYPDPEWSSRSSSLVTRRQEGPAVHLQSLSAARKASPDPGWSSRASHSLSAARKAYPDPEWSSRSSLLAIRRQEGVSGPRVVQAFIFNCYPPPGRRFRTATGLGVYRHSLSAARKAYPDRDSSRRLSSLVIRHQEGVSGSRVVQVFILTRYPPPGRRIGTPSGPGAHLHSLSAARKAYPDPEWSRRSSALAIRLQKGVSGPRVVPPFIFTHCPPPGRRFQTATGPTVHLHSLSAARKAHPDPEWSSRSSSLAIHCHEGVSGPRLVQVIIFTRYPPPERRIGTPSGPVVHLHSLSAARKAYPDPEWSRRPSALAIRLQKGVSGPRVVQSFIFTRDPPPGRGTGTPSVLPFIFTRYPPPGRRIRTPSGPSVHLQSLSAARKAVPDRDWSRRSSSLVYPPPGRHIRSRGANRSS